MELEEQHPIPQQISAYQFRLVGDMTLKQFFQVAGGALVALLVYSSNLATYVKWPLIIGAFLTGVAFAFFPLQDRPLSTWILLFIKSIYSPTLYVWRKTEKRQEHFIPEPGVAAVQATAIKSTAIEQLQAVHRTQKPTETTHTAPELKKLEENEQQFLTSVSKQFASPSITPPPLINQPPTRIIKDIKIPQVSAPSVEKQEVLEKPSVQIDNTLQTSGEITLTPTVGKKVTGAQVAQFSQESAPPSPPTKANVIVGQVMDSQGNIVEGAILEIRDSEGRPVRALKSNKLGHFMIVTPLASGKYEIITEKEGLNFEPITIEAKDEIIPPIAIWEKSQKNDVLPNTTLS